MKLGLIIGALWISFSCYGAEEGFPPDCHGLVVRNESIMLHTKEPIIVLLHNQSGNDLWITHPVSEPNASAGWSSRLEAGNWSALTLDKENFELSCIESKPGHEQQIPCAEMLNVCEWSLKMPTEERGTFWAGENMSLNAILAHLEGRGYKLPHMAK